MMRVPPKVHVPFEVLVFRALMGSTGSWHPLSSRWVGFDALVCGQMSRERGECHRLLRSGGAVSSAHAQRQARRRRRRSKAPRRGAAGGRGEKKESARKLIHLRTDQKLRRGKVRDVCSVYDLAQQRFILRHDKESKVQSL